MIAREYQITQVDKTIDEVSRLRKVLAQLPTGGGKTVEFTLIAQKYIRGYLNDNSHSVLILVHREELMFQAQKTIKEVLDIDPYLITPQTKYFNVSRVYIGMVESTLNRLDLIHNVGLVIIDECHVNVFNKVHSLFLEELIIGFSATPISASKKEPLNKYYRAIITGPQISQLIEMKFLCQNSTRIPREIVDVSKFGYDAMKGDYNERAMAMEYQLPKFVTNVFHMYDKWCKGKKTIIFNVNIEHSKEVAQCMSFMGLKCRHLDATSSSRPSSVPGFSDERKEIIHWFRTTKDAILCNVMIATLGFDEPTIECVMTNFSTLSLTKYLQACGRGGRIIDQLFIDKYQKDYPYELQFKNTFSIMDMGGNYIRFGDWNQDRDWDYIFNYPASPGNGIAPVKECPACDGLVHAATRICMLTNEQGEICMHEFERRNKREEVGMIEMQLVTSQSFDERIEDIKSVGRKKYDFFVFMEVGQEIVNDMLRKHPEPSETILLRYFKKYYQICCDWYLKEMAGKEGNLDEIETSGFHIRKAKNNFNNQIIKKNPRAKILTLEHEWDWNKEVVDEISEEKFAEILANS